MNKSDDKRSFRTASAYPFFNSGIWQYIISAFAILLSSSICYHFTSLIGYQSVSFILLFVVSILSIFMGIGPITLASALSAFIWNFFFIPPQFTISIDKTEDALMFCMFFIIALVNGIFTTRVRRQERLTRDREERTKALYELTKGLANADSMNELIATAITSIKIYFRLDAVFLLASEKDSLKEFPGNAQEGYLTSDEVKAARQIFESISVPGGEKDYIQAGTLTYYPLKGNLIKPGIMAVRHSGQDSASHDPIWDTFLTQISNAIEKEFLNELALKARFLDESDKLYKTLFNSISHELRIPVATIMSASESMLATTHSEELRKEISREVLKASTRLNRLIENLLNMSRLESGRITPRLDWCDIHDLINKVTDDLDEELRPFNLIIEVSEDMPLVLIDFGLMQQVLYNLIFNATQYASASTSLRVTASYSNGVMTLEVMDRGPGFPENELPLIFNKFYRLEGSRTGGTGLGLSIAKGFTEALNGTISAENRQNGGAKFTIRIPSEKPNVDIKA